MQALRWIVGATLFVALLFLAFQNADSVTLKFYGVWSWQAPLIVIVFVVFAIGVASGLLAGAMRAARLKRQLNRLRREQRKRDAPPVTRPPVDAGAPLDGI